jgi:hypothetical protein
MSDIPETSEQLIMRLHRLREAFCEADKKS